MGISFEAVAIPDWLTRYFVIADLATDGRRFDRELLTVLQNQRPGTTFETAPVINWIARVRAASLPDGDEVVQFEKGAAAIEAAEAKLTATTLPPPPAQADAGSEMIYGIREAHEAVRLAAGKFVKALGPTAVALAIVGTAYRGAHTAIWHFNDGTDFGIDDATLARFLDELHDGDIFESASRGRGRDIVRITSRGRNWFEEQIKEKPVSNDEDEPAADIEAWTDARREIDDIESHLGFMTDADLRNIAKSLLVEIDKNIRSRASLSTMIVCGSLVETMLLDIAEQMPDKLKFAEKANWADNVSLTAILDELFKLDLVGETAKGTTIAYHRDLVHPNRRRKAKIRIDPKAASAMTLLAAILAHDLDDAAKKGVIERIKNA